mmetsp:Transcript_56856/g.133402  ORF Transcript_56856/g.133402 Transcript_56856/m.133402 type:complete len:83 (+) Transcript_56856:27-275(+)
MCANFLPKAFCLLPLSTTTTRSAGGKGGIVGDHIRLDTSVLQPFKECHGHLPIPTFLTYSNRSAVCDDAGLQLSLFELSQQS